MNSDKLYISIIDTEENILVNQDELTQYKAPRLAFKGADDKYAQVMGSTLSFNLLVDDAQDGKFLHLFTGSETRYKVLLQDYTDENNIVTVWQGFLLAEQYSEPYENGSFFVDFKATDGLGTLKNKYLPDDYYYDVQSLTSFIAEALKLTGSELPIKLAPAIENAVVDFNYDKLEINGSIYLSDRNKKTSAYKILEGLLKSMGCKIFQWNATWYIIGMNRMHELTIETQNFDSDGAYQNTTSLKRFNDLAYFEGTPQISMHPPLKTVEVSWDVEDSFSLLPDWIVYQTPYTQTSFDYSVKGWNQTGALFDTELKATTQAGTTVDLASADYYTILGSDNFYVSLSPSLTAAQTETNYIDTDTVYVNGAISYGQSIDVEINGVMWFDGSVKTNLDSDASYKNKLIYKVFIDDTVIIENTEAFDTNGIFDFEFTQGLDERQAKFSVSVKSLPINKSGALKVRLYPLVTTTGATLKRVTYTELSIELNDDNELNPIKTRSINYSTSQDVSLEIGSSYNEKLLNKFLVSDTVPFTSYSYTIAPGFVNVPYLNYYSNSFYSEYLFQETGDGDVEEVVLFFEKDEYFYLLNNQDKIYRKAYNGAGNVIAVTDFKLEDNSLRGFVLAQYNVEPAEEINDGDILGVLFSPQDVTVTDRNYLLNTWKRHGITENENWLECLARTYHDVSANPTKQIEGTLFGLYGPLDLLEFYYMNPVNYQVMRLDLDLSQGTTKATITECLNEEVTDYVK